MRKLGGLGLAFSSAPGAQKVIVMRQPSFEHPVAPLSAADRGEIDLIALFREVGRRKWIVVAVTIGALALSTLAVNVIKPRFTAETRVFLENRDTEYTRIGRDGGRGADPLIDQDAVLSQVQIIQSRDIARAMISRFDLGKRPEFDGLLNGMDGVTKVGVMLGLIHNPASMSPEERVLERYFDKLKAFAVAKSRVVAIEFQSRDPELAAQLTDAIAEEYIRQLEAAKKGSAKAAGSWLGRTIESLRERVAAAEAKVEAYRTQNGLFLVGAGADGGSITAQQLSELNTQLAASRSQQAELAAKARNIREAIRQGRIFEVSDIVNNEVVRRLIESRATLKALLAQEERTLLPQHPRVKELRAQLGGLEEQVRAAAERAARALENDARAAGARVAASQAELDLQKRASGTANEQEVQLRALEREAKAEREQLETYLTRWRDATVRDADNAVAADARIVSRAIVPSNPSFPKRLPIIIVATLAALAMSLFWILTRALLSDAVYARRRDSHAPAFAPWSMGQVQPYVLNLSSVASAAFASPPVAQAQPPQPSYAAPAGEAPATVDARPLRPAEPQPSSGLRRSLDKVAAVLASTAPAADRPQEQTASQSAAAARDTIPPLLEPHPEPEVALAAPRPPGVGAALRRPLDSIAQAPAAAGTQVLTPRASAGLRGPLPIDAPPLAPAAEEFERFIRSRQAAEPASAQLTVSAPSEIENPLIEVAEEAEAALIRGRPVSILLLSVEGGPAAAPTAAALRRILEARGGGVAAMREQPSTAAQLTALLRSAAGSMDFAIINLGAVNAASGAMSRAATLTVLVAPDELEDSRTDEACRELAGCNYFIVGAAASVLPTAT